MNRRTLMTSAAIVLGLGTAALAGSHGDPVKAGFIYVGPIGDGGWTYEHDKGRLAVEAHFGDKVETIYQETVPEGADAERAITQMALSGRTSSLPHPLVTWIRPTRSRPSSRM